MHEGSAPMGDHSHAFQDKPNPPSDLPADDSLPRLGSLAQSAREKHLKKAKGWLIFLGIAWILIHGFFLVNLPNEVRNELTKAGAFGPGANASQVKQAETAMYAAGYL